MSRTPDALRIYRKSPLIRKGSFCLVCSTLLDQIPGLAYGFFTRHGGISKGYYKSLNVAYSVGDDPENVSRNIEFIRKFLGFKSIVWGRQVHGTKIVFVNDEKKWHYPEADAFIVKSAGVGIMIKTGDCQAILIVDPELKITAAVHCGWRGSVKNIVEKVVSVLCLEFGSKPANLVAAVGPSLGPCCAEFVNFKRELPKPFWKYQMRPKFFDFWAITKNQLIQAGLTSENIDITGWCTFCNPDLFFSYRRRKKSGRMAAVIGFRNIA